MSKQIAKAFDWLVKLASLAITASSTWQVATNLFVDIQDATLFFVMRVAALVVIESVFYSNWIRLDFDKQASPQIKTRYALTALGMYGAMVIIGIKHEGWIGAIFRIALLAALLGSCWDTGVYTLNKMTAQIDRSIEASWQFRRFSRKLAITEAKQHRLVDHTVAMRQLELNQQLEMARADIVYKRQFEQLNEQPANTGERLGEQINNLLNNGYTPSQAAKELNCSRTTIYKYRNGKLKV